MLSRSILSNYLGALFGLAVSRGLRFVAVVYCVRMAGDYTWGQTVSSLAIVSFLALLMDQGLGASPLLFRLRDRAADARLVRLVSGYRFAMAVVLLAALHAVNRLVLPLDALALTYALVLLPRAFAIEWWFQRRELYQFTTYIASFRTLGFFLLALAFVRPGAGAETILYIEIASEAASIAFAHLLARRAAPVPGGEEAEPFGIGTLVRFSFPFLLIAVLNNIQTVGDVLMLRAFAGEVETARYDMGIKISMLYFFVGATLVQILRPKLTRLHQAGETGRLTLLLRTASTQMVLVSSLLLLPSLYFAEPVVRLLYGRDIPLTAFVFRWGPLWVGTSFVTMLTADTLLSLGRRKAYVLGAFAAAIVILLANLALLPRFGGQGAVFAKVLSELAFLAIAMNRLPPDVLSGYRKGLWLQVGSLVVLATVFLASDGLGIPLAGLAVSLVFLGCVAWRRRAFSRETLAVLREN